MASISLSLGFVARGGDAVEVDGDVVVRLDPALAVRTPPLCDGDEGVVATGTRRFLIGDDPCK